MEPLRPHDIAEPVLRSIAELRRDYVPLAQDECFIGATTEPPAEVPPVLIGPGGDYRRSWPSPPQEHDEEPERVDLDSLTTLEAVAAAVVVAVIAGAVVASALSWMG